MYFGSIIVGVGRKIRIEQNNQYKEEGIVLSDRVKTLKQETHA